MLKLCPKCRSFSVEYDPHQMLELCLDRECNWVNRGSALSADRSDEEVKAFSFSLEMEERVSKAAEQGMPA